MIPIQEAILEYLLFLYLHNPSPLDVFSQEEALAFCVWSIHNQINLLVFYELTINLRIYISQV